MNQALMLPVLNLEMVHAVAEDWNGTDRMCNRSQVCVPMKSSSSPIDASHGTKNNRLAHGTHGFFAETPGCPPEAHTASGSLDQLSV